MATNDIKLIQEQNDGGFIERTVPGTPGSVLAVDESGLPTTRNEADPVFAAWFASASSPTPTGLAATVVSSTVINLSWNASPRAVIYNVYQDGVLWDTTNLTSYSSDGLTPETEYSYTVSAVNVIGESAQCEPVVATTDAAPVGNYALQFDGANSYASVESLTLASDFTIEAWVKVGSDGYIFSSSGDPGLMSVGSGGYPQFYDGANWHYASVLNIADSNWHHLAVTKSGTSYSFWLDGEGEAFSGESTVGITGAAYFGQAYNFGGRFSGVLDEIRISSVVRYTGSFTPAYSHTPDADTVAYWKLNEGTGTTSADLSGNGHTLTLAGDPAPAWVAGVVQPDKALEFDGSQNYASVAADADFYADTFTCEAWVKGSGTGVFLSTMNGSPYSEGWLLYASGDSPSCLEGGAVVDGTYYDTNTGAVIGDDQWHHIAMTFDGADLRFWLDGVLVATDNKPGSMSVGTNQLGIGAWKLNGTWVNFAGYTIDEARISSVVRYTDTFTPATSHAVDADTVAYWKLNEGAGSTAFDASGNGHDATLTGDPLPAWVDGVTKADRALSYASGSQASATVPGTAAWTFECWFKLNNAPDSTTRRLLNSNSDTLYFGYSSSGLCFGTSGWAVSGGSITSGVWHHAAASSDGSTSKLFLDGELIDTSANGHDYTGTLNLEIGFNSTQEPETLDGVIDEVRVSSVSRYTTTFVPATSHTVDSDTVAYWKLNEGTGTTAADSSGNGHDGTLTGDPLPAWVDGVTA